MKTAPTVGRVVLYWPTEGENCEVLPVQPMAANVAYVWNDNMVNLSIAAHNGSVFGKTSIVMAEEDTDAKPGECEWMPYQKEQAAKSS